MGLQRITFWSHPITWSWNKATNLFRSTGGDEIFIKPSGAVDVEDKSYSIPCMVSQMIIAAILLYMLYRFVKSIKF